MLTAITCDKLNQCVNASFCGTKTTPSAFNGVAFAVRKSKKASPVVYSCRHFGAKLPVNGEKPQNWRRIIAIVGGTITGINWQTTRQGHFLWFCDLYAIILYHSGQVLIIVSSSDCRINIAHRREGTMITPTRLRSKTCVQIK